MQQPAQSPTLPGQPAHVMQAQQLRQEWWQDFVAQQSPEDEEATSAVTAGIEEPDLDPVPEVHTPRLPPRGERALQLANTIKALGPSDPGDEENRRELSRLTGCQILRDEYVSKADLAGRAGSVSA